MSLQALSQIFAAIQIVTAVLLIVVILMQRQSSSLSGAFGGEGTSYFTKRGPEKVLFLATVFIAIVFIGVTVARNVL